jgi:SAM-dependent methyltransferase
VIPDSAALARIIIAMDYDQSDIATTYDEARALTPARHRRWQRLLSAHVDRTAISLVVDLGCGTGRFCEMLAAELDVGPRIGEGSKPGSLPVIVAGRVGRLGFELVAAILAPHD